MSVLLCRYCGLPIDEGRDDTFFCSDEHVRAFALKVLSKHPTKAYIEALGRQQAREARARRERAGRLLETRRHAVARTV